MSDDELLEAGRSLTGDVRVVVLEGTWDLGPFSWEAVSWLLAPDMVSVAALSGPVTATGLALACDLRLAGDATVLRFAGLPDGSHRLVAAVGPSRAAEWCLTGREVTAQEAWGAGLLSTVVPAAGLGEALDAVLAALLAVPRGVAAETKALLQGAGHRTPEQQWKAEADARARALQEE